MNPTALVANPRFFASTGPHPLGVVAATAGCDGVLSVLPIVGLAPLEAARANEVSLFIGNPRHAAGLAGTCAGAVLVAAEVRHLVPAGSVPIVVRDPVVGWARLAALFHPAPCVRPGVHPTAAVASDARIDATAEVCARAVIGARAEIGPRCRIGAGAVIDDGVVLGPDCRIGANASISHALLGARVYVYPGARIGQEGFGFAIGESGFVTVPQLGGVVLEDDVEVGANTTIDRGSLTDTVIGAGTRLDNLVQIAHGVRIGRHCAVAAQVGVSGSVEIGDFTVIGGQAGVAEHMKVGSKVRIGAQSGVMSNVEAGAVVAGSPARPVREVFREIAVLKKLAARPAAPAGRA